MRKFWILKMIAFGAVAILAFGFITMHLWNWLLPALFGFPAISLLQAFGLLILSKILFGGFGGGRGGFGGQKHHYWKQRMFEKWERMTPEQREEFKKNLKNRFGGWKKDFYETPTE